ncbi:MAG TPA: flagellar hook-length control protein FliK, partial [Burkholderiales bacterium]|nr:flagellar hook-length control protein FliK [Burkholderiales bacterium]
AHKITWMVGEQHPVAELHVNPPDLGPLEIRLTLSGDDNATASAQFASPHAPVREAIEAALPRLREMLAESGITLGNAAIADGALPRDREDRPSGHTGTAFSNESQAAAALPGTDATRLATVRRNHGLVDIFA